MKKILLWDFHGYDIVNVVLLVYLSYRSFSLNWQATDASKIGNYEQASYYISLSTQYLLVIIGVIVLVRLTGIKKEIRESNV